VCAREPWRSCRARRKDGEWCDGWALWDSEEQVCLVHAGRHHRGPISGRGWTHVYSQAPPCRCAGGYCRWPDPPIYRVMTPAGTHDWPRLRGGLAMFKMLKRVYAERERELARLVGQGR
jgi:hypothetical protein